MIIFSLNSVAGSGRLHVERDTRLVSVLFSTNGVIFFSVPSKIEFSHILILSLSLLCLPLVSAVKQSVSTHAAQRERDAISHSIYPSLRDAGW